METLKIGSLVRFVSEDRVLLGAVVQIKHGLYGIEVKDRNGIFWRDRDALASVEKCTKEK